MSILEGVAKKQGCTVFRIDRNGVVVDVAGLSSVKPDRILGQKIIERVPYPTEARILKKLAEKTRSTGEVTTRIVPVYHQGEVHDIRLCLRRCGPDHLVVTFPRIVYIRQSPE